ncbi:MAG: lactococcin 972 family bacteriocin [Bifidobacteriaceae bacterium]|jgi:hypothetical protein|nr:lactococcin 972 family bacteriocin [Bifidobacteriaceae bacterium]
MLGGAAAPAAFAGGADGDFSCTQSGVPGWGTVTSRYTHYSKKHYATAKGRNYVTVSAAAGKQAVAKDSRALSGNECFYGVS